MAERIEVSGSYRNLKQRGQAQISLDGKDYAFPVVEGSEGERAVDITNLRKACGYITLDAGYQNTGSCISGITYIDGEAGILRYRGIPIEQLAEQASFVETAYLLVHGVLPKKQELRDFRNLLTANSMIHEDMLTFFHGLPRDAHPMAILSSMVNSLSIYYPEVVSEEDSDEAELNIAMARLISKIRTIAAFSFKKSVGEPFVYPSNYTYCANFLHMMFSTPVQKYKLNHVVIRALNQLLILHADHEQNCSTSTVRLVGSSKVNLYASICAGICALWGPLHGGANQSVIESLEEIRSNNIPVKKFIEMVKDKNNPRRLMGFGHRVYRNYDPRARIIKNTCGEVLGYLKRSDPLLDIAQELEEIALHDDYFIERKLYPNVDFYSGIIYRAIGIPTNMFTVMFAIGRLPGWIAQWKEMHNSEPFNIGRPRQIYTGPTVQDYIPISAR
ncbi:MAG: citrate synthase [Spirochaetota bacterium]|jgi:citrate synthase|nr:citrate synthase [Spirochaetota bacterium]